MSSILNSSGFLSPAPPRHLDFRNIPNNANVPLVPKCTMQPSKRVNNLRIAFTTITETLDPIQVPFTRPVPSYLSDHVFYYNGPAIYHVPHRDGAIWRPNHWFDAIGMVHSFRFDATLQSLHYRSRNINQPLVDTIRATNAENFVAPQVGKSITASWLQWLRRLGPFTVNPNTRSLPYNNVVSLQTIPGKGPLNARTDVNVAQTLDPTTLEPQDPYTFAQFHPSLRGDFSCAHGMYDRHTKEYFNFVYGITGLKVDYKVFRIAPTGQSDILASFKDYPNYLHSFALTPHYVVMILCPCQYDLVKLVTTKSISDSVRFRAHIPTKFVVISRKHANVIATYEYDPFFVFHVVNAYEQEDDIVIDLAYYRDPSILQNLHIDNIMSGGKIAKATPVRFTLPDISQAASIHRNSRLAAKRRHLAQIDIELATVSPQREQKPYLHMYGVSDGSCDQFHGDVVKLNVQSGAAARWRSPNMLTNEPVFVPDPQGIHEDAGSLLVVTLDLKTETSSLVILDAKTMRETARARLPTPIPLGFHGTVLKVPPATNKNVYMEAANLESCES